MCEVTSEFTLCTCANGQQEPVAHNRHSRRYKKMPTENKPPRISWTLFRYLGKEHIGMIGMMILPAGQLTETLTAGYVQQELNRRHCFDFEYTPAEGDCLTMELSTGEKKSTRYEYHYMSFIFRNGQWVIDFYDAFMDKLAEIQKGRLKFS